jgi:hypothetical protein
MLPLAAVEPCQVVAPQVESVAGLNQVVVALSLAVVEVLLLVVLLLAEEFLSVEARVLAKL